MIWSQLEIEYPLSAITSLISSYNFEICFHGVLSIDVFHILMFLSESSSLALDLTRSIMTNSIIQPEKLKQDYAIKKVLFSLTNNGGKQRTFEQNLQN